MKKPTLRVDEVADELRVSRATVYRAIKSGELQSFKFRDTRRIEREALEEFKKNGNGGKSE